MLMAMRFLRHDLSCRLNRSIVDQGSLASASVANLLVLDQPAKRSF